MAAPRSLTARLWPVVLPTPGQALGFGILAISLLVLTQTNALLTNLGITPDAIDVARGKLGPSFHSILQSSAASNVALVTFWATVGLVAYIICWGAYNVIIEARNEVTLTTAYTNRGHWRGARETLALKVASAVGLTILLISLNYSLALWIALGSQAIVNVNGFGIMTLITGLAAIAGLAGHLYLTLVFVELTFTPWYRTES